MNDIFKNNKVDVLRKYISDAKLRKFVENLPKFNISTLYDLKSATEEEMQHVPGFGIGKWNYLRKTQEILQANCEQIVSDCETEKQTLNSVELDGIPEDFLNISLEWLLSSQRVDDVTVYSSIICNTLTGYSIKDLLTLNVHNIHNKRGVGRAKVEKIESLQRIITSISNDEKKVEELRTSYIESQAIPVLPSIGEAGESLSSLIKRFIEEVAARYEVCGKKDCAEIIRLAYKYGYDIKSISINRDKTRTRIEQLLTDRNPSYKSFIWILHNNLNASDRLLLQLYEVSDQFRKAIQDIQDFCGKTPTKTTLVSFLGEGADDNVINFILHYLGAKIFGGDIGAQTRIKDEFIVVDCDKKHLNNKWGEIFTLLDQCVKPIKKESLIIELRKKFSPLPKNVENIIISIVENSSQFEIKKTDITTEYSLKWQELSSMQSRLERILYESKTSMQKNELENEYNRRLMECGMENPDVFLIRTSKNIHQLHEGGTWIWKEYTNEKKTISREKLIRQYIAQRQKIRIEDIMEYLRKIIPEIKEQSVKTILTKYCISTTEGYYIDKKSKADYSDLHISTSEDITPNLIKIMSKAKEYTYHELYDIYRDKYKIAVPESKIRKTCENPDIFTIIKGENRRVPNKVKINPMWNGNYEVRNRNRGIVAEWKRNVREEIINKLRYSPNYEMSHKELCKHLISYIPKDVSHTGLYKIFDDENIFIVNDKEGGKGKIVALNIDKWETELKQHLENKDSCASTCNYDSEEEHILQDAQQKQLGNPRYNMSTETSEDLNNLFASTQSLISYNLQQLDNDNMNIADMKDGWEFMVKQMNIRGGGVDNAYYRMLNKLYAYMFGATSRDDRYYLWVEIRLNYEPYLKKLLSLKGCSIIKTDGRDMQLKDLINLCQTNNILPRRDDRCHITQCVSSMLQKRNYRGHNAEDTPNDTIIVQNIQKSLTLYLYTSMQFKNLIKN